MQTALEERNTAVTSARAEQQISAELYAALTAVFDTFRGPVDAATLERIVRFVANVLPDERYLEARQRAAGGVAIHMVYNGPLVPPDAT